MSVNAFQDFPWPTETEAGTATPPTSGSAGGPRPPKSLTRNTVMSSRGESREQEQCHGLQTVSPTSSTAGCAPSPAEYCAAAVMRGSREESRICQRGR